MPRCLADRYGAASGAWGLDGSSDHSTRFSEVGPGMGPAGMERTRQRARRARLSLVGVDRSGDVAAGELEHGEHSKASPWKPRGYARRSDRWKTNAVVRLPEGAVALGPRLVWVVLMREQLGNELPEVKPIAGRG